MNVTSERRREDIFGTISESGMLTNVCGSIPCPHAGGSSTAQRKKNIYIIFRRTLEIELALCVSRTRWRGRSATPGRIEVSYWGLRKLGIGKFPNLLRTGLRS